MVRVDPRSYVDSRAVSSGCRGCLAVILLATAGLKLSGPLRGAEPVFLLIPTIGLECLMGIVALTRFWRSAAWFGVMLAFGAILLDLVGGLSAECGCLGGLERLPGLRVMVSATLGLVSVAALRSATPGVESMLAGASDHAAPR